MLIRLAAPVVIALALTACSSATPAPQTPATASAADEIGCLKTGQTGSSAAAAVPTTTTTQPFRAAPRVRQEDEEKGSDAVYAELRHQLDTYQKSDYQHTTTVNRSAGTYIVDCSGWGNVLLRAAACPAYADLVRITNETRGAGFLAGCDLGIGAIEHGPYAADWASMLAQIEPGTTNGHWTRRATVAELVPGDIVTYALGPGATDTGHVMFVAAKPTPTADPTRWVVPIADSTAFQHGPTDSRKNNPRNVDGEGIGTAEILLITDKTGAPTTQFLWYPTATKVDTVPNPVLLGHLN
ncbi:hypothetical protein [Actinokineospora globicatena]|uniref:CHAP domain-containing protein n=1 Tax=Actinokineospora globicatena TaxID=103729 RepID=A0A9W6QGT0_9PSEU|nr:hypothetical protein [Actinokineospora globicatena]GLW89490.1 hypothetical protein Aglo03_03060 [Actinokineospora globicatena]